LGLAFNIK
jgi:hypothetical protein